MIKLRTILLCNYPYYIILFIALFYFLITNFFITYKSNYEEIENIDAKIIDITIKDYGIKLILKNKEKLSFFYEFHINFPPCILAAEWFHALLYS